MESKNRGVNTAIVIVLTVYKYRAGRRTAGVPSPTHRQAAGYQVFAKFHYAGTAGPTSLKGTKTGRLSDFCKNQSAQIAKTAKTRGFTENT